MTLVSTLTQTAQLRDQDPNHQRATDIIFYSCSPKIHLYYRLILSPPKIWIEIKKFELIIAAAVYKHSSTIIKC